MRNFKGFSAIEGLLIIVIVGILGFTGWYVYNSKQNADKSNTASTQVSSSTATKAAADPYAGWKTYTSTYEKSSYRYPSDWKSVAPKMTGQDANADAYQLQSPSGKVTVSWISGVGGVGGACSDKVQPPAVDADGIGACPHYEVVDNQKIAGADLYYVSGTYTSDGSTYSPFFALQNSKGITKTGGYLGLLLFTCKQTDSSCGLMGGTAISGGGFDKTTKAQAQAFLSNSEAKQAKLILLSYKY